MAAVPKGALSILVGYCQWRTRLAFILVTTTIFARGTTTASAQPSLHHTPPPPPDDAAPQHCATWSGASCDWEPNLRPLQVQQPFGGTATTTTFYAYVTPDVSTFYNATASSRKPKIMRNTGMFGKFINLSPDPIQVYWDGGKGTDNLVYISDVEPFGSAGTATYPGHVFVVRQSNHPEKTIITWTMLKDNSLYYYDPFDFNYNKAAAALTPEQLTYYYMQLQNRLFANQYKAFTGTDWLALYGQKQAPRFHMWRADAIGETRTIETSEIHFVQTPALDELKRGVSVYGPRPDEKSRYRRYRDKYATMNLTMTVLSCAPRVFEIKNFLSDLEVDHILGIAKGTHLHRSGTQASEKSQVTKDDATRTSTNTWIPRNTDMITDGIYQRAADLLQIDEALLRWRHANEIPEFSESKISIAERLQLVHYDVGQKYTPHHDFRMPGLVNLQPSRFATILFYLNDDMEGGETTFPIWLNAETSDALKVKPERGKAILFYSLLPDGNFDARSLHEASPVTRGEKVSQTTCVYAVTCFPALDQILFVFSR
jgi:prolyl 4-hydroxylase